MIAAVSVLTATNGLNPGLTLQSSGGPHRGSRVEKPTKLDPIAVGGPRLIGSRRQLKRNFHARPPTLTILTHKQITIAEGTFCRLKWAYRVELKAKGD